MHAPGSGDTARPKEHVPARTGYDRWAEIYDAEDNPLIALEEKHLSPLLGDLAGKRVADLGCGTGRLTLALASRGAEVTALDFSEGMMARAKEKAGAERVRFVVHDLADPLPFEAGALDAVVSALVLEHIFDLDRFFRDVRRAVRPGGFAAFSAMHPAMVLRGVTAHFTDPRTGADVRPESRPRSVSDYVLAAHRAGFAFEHLSEHAIDEEIASRSPRSVKYLGWPMLFLMKVR